VELFGIEPGAFAAMQSPRSATVLPMHRCPVCRALLPEAAHAADFGHPSVWWRAAVADSYPLCPRCYVESELDDRLRERAVAGALRWWVMDQELQRYRRLEVAPVIVV